MPAQALTVAHKAILRNQEITASQHGSLLHDFGVILDAVGQGGVEAGGKHHLLPMKLIKPLDQRLSRPLDLQLTRPQLRSHPYLQALYLLLRASGLGRLEKAGTKTRLTLDPVLKPQWDHLNPTEQYFNLLEAAFRYGDLSMVGAEDREPIGLLSRCQMAWSGDRRGRGMITADNPEFIYVSGIGRNWSLIALMDLFGFVSVKNPPAPITTWYPAGLNFLPLGDAVFTLLPDKAFDFSNDDEPEEEALGEFHFGVWQPLFQPYFPEWQRNLEPPRNEPREGMFIFKVSIDDAWRRIAIPSRLTLDNLAETILKAFKFEEDHLYEFRFRNRLGIECAIHHPKIEEPPFTDEVNIGKLPLELGQSMTFHFDFGDDWLFDVKLEAIEPLDKRKRPSIIERYGKAPSQYPNWDE